MIGLSIDLTTDQVPVRKLNRIRRETNRAAGEFIAGKLLPQKFTRSAYYEGTADRRSRKYAERKSRKVGHDIPLVYSGRMKRAVLSSARSRITATADGGKVRPKNYFPMPDYMRNELERLSPRQVRRLAKLMEEKFTAAVNDPANRRKRRRTR